MISTFGRGDALGSKKFIDPLCGSDQLRIALRNTLPWASIFLAISNVYAGQFDSVLRVTPRERVIHECRQLISKKVRSDVNFLGNPSAASTQTELMANPVGMEEPIPDYFDFKIEYVSNGFVEGKQARCYVDRRQAQPVAKQVGFLRN